MFQLKQGKILIKIILSIMCVALLSFSCLYFVNKERKDAEPQGVSTYNISSEEDLLVAARAMAVNSQDDATIELYADLDMTGYDFHPIGMMCTMEDGNITEFYGCSVYLGTFYGNGHTIRNLTINYYPDYTVTPPVEREMTNYLGLFACFAGECYGVRLENMTINSDPTYYYHKQSPYGWLYEDCYCGAIAGCARYDSVIEGCVVDGFTVNDFNTHEYSTCGGLVGDVVISQFYEEQNYITITNCYLSNFDVSGIPSERVAQISYDIAGKTIANECLVKQSSYSLFKSSNSSTNRCYSTLNTSRNALEGLDGWYVPPSTEFNDGWPYPYDPWFYEFIEFGSAYLDINGDVNESTYNSDEDYDKYDLEITLPFIYLYFSSTGEEELIGPEILLNKEDGSFFGTDVTLTPPSKDYEFLRWKFLGDMDAFGDAYDGMYLFYKAEYKSQKVILTFGSITQNGQTVKPTVETYEISPNSIVDITYNYSTQKVEVKTGSYVITTYALTSTHFKKYYCKPQTINVATAATSITPTIELKSYGVQVK